MSEVLNRHNKAGRSFMSRLWGRTIYQRILRFYFLTVVVGALLLCLPISSTSNVSILDCIFTSVSAFTNTGLSTKTTSSDFTFFGQFIILLLIQFGGIGFLTIIIILWAWIRREGTFSVEQRRFLHFERGSYRKVESLASVKAGITVLIISEFIAAFVLTFYFFYATPDKPTSVSTVASAASSTVSNNDVADYKGKFLESLWAAIFHSVSAANNAGFDILGKYSIAPYRNDANNMLSVILLIESVIGGIGYPIFYDLYQWYKKKEQNKPAYLSLFSKISIFTYFLIAALAIFLVLCFETILAPKYTNSIMYSSGSTSDNTQPKDPFSWGRNEILNKIWNIIYLTFSSRSSGFTPIDITLVTPETKWLLSILMFIGTSPASTGGGIRTITIFIIFAKMFRTSQGRSNLSVWNKTIDPNIVFDSCSVFVISTILLVTSIFLVMISYPSSQRVKIGDVAFETSSAFGTAGLTAKVTENCNFLGKIILMFLMFIGQLGVSNTLLSFSDFKSKSQDKRYCSEELRIM